MSDLEDIKDTNVLLNSDDSIQEIDQIHVDESLVKLINDEDKYQITNQISKTKSKNCSIELCRILAGFLVINCHLISHGLRGIPKYPHNPLIFLNNISLTCNTLFICISAFFLCDSRFSITRIIRFWLVTFINLYYAYYIMDKYKLVVFKSQETFNCWFWFFQVNDIWYSTCYLTFIVIMPFISKLSERVGKYSHFFIVLFLIYTTSIGNAKPSGCRFSIDYNVDFFLVVAVLMTFYKKYIFEKSIFWGFPVLIFLYTSQIRFLRGQWKINPNSHVVIKTFIRGFYAHSVTGTSQILMGFSIFHILSHIPVHSFFYYPLTFIGKTVYGSYVIGDNGKMRGCIYKKIKIKELVYASGNNMIKPMLIWAGKLYIWYIFLSGLINIPLDLLIFDRNYYKNFSRKIDNFLN